MGISYTPGPPGRSRYGHECRPGVGRGADLAEPFGAVAGDEGDVGEGLDVVDQRRAPVDAALGEVVQVERRFGVASVEPVDQGGGLPGDVAVRGGFERGCRSCRIGRRAVRRGPLRRRGCSPGAVRSMQTMASRAPTAAAAAAIPSRTRWGTVESRTLSLALAGSPSVPLATTTARRPAATAAILTAVGKPAPPRPLSPAALMSSMRSWPPAAGGAEVGEVLGQRRHRLAWGRRRQVTAGASAKGQFDGVHRRPFPEATSRGPLSVEDEPRFGAVC